MKNSLLLFFLALLPTILAAQRLQVLSAGGQQLEGSDASITATIGEVCVSLHAGSGQQVTEGFQQGLKPAVEVPGTAADRDPLSATNALQALLFPNPAMERVQVAFQNTDGHPLRLCLFNSLGLLLQEAETVSTEHSFDVSMLPAGHYWLAVLPAQNRPTLILPFEKINR